MLACRMDEIERKLRLAGLRAERSALYRIARSHKLSDETARKLVRKSICWTLASETR